MALFPESFPPDVSHLTSVPPERAESPLPVGEPSAKLDDLSARVDGVKDLEGRSSEGAPKELDQRKVENLDVEAEKAADIERLAMESFIKEKMNWTSEDLREMGKKHIIFLGDSDHTDPAQEAVRDKIIEYFQKYYPLEPPMGECYLSEAVPFGFFIAKPEERLVIKQIHTGWENPELYNRNGEAVRARLQVMQKLTSHQHEFEDKKNELEKARQELIQNGKEEEIPKLVEEKQKELNEILGSMKTLYERMNTLHEISNLIVDRRTFTMVESAKKARAFGNRVFVHAGALHIIDPVRNFDVRRLFPGEEMHVAVLIPKRTVPIAVLEGTPEKMREATEKMLEKSKKYYDVS